MKVGDTVWLLDGNQRTYPAEGFGGPIYRKMFVEYRIVSETRISWLLGRGDWKIDKATKKLRKPKDGYFAMSPHVFESKSDVDDACYVQENRIAVANAVQNLKSAAVLRTIKGILEANGHTK